MTRKVPDAHVVAWYLRQDSESLFTTTITLAEILDGIDLLPEGGRRDQLTRFADDFFRNDLDGKIIAFDDASVVQYAKIRASKSLIGMSISSLDAQMRQIAAAAGASVATRNVDDFKHSGITVINPWIE
jgi:predicted nucleic acid-binding protein